MTEKAKKKSARGRAMLQSADVPFTKVNYQLFAIVFVVLAVGYWALAQSPVDGFLTLTLAPILLVIGYCVLIPLAIMLGGKKDSKPAENT